VLHRSDCRAHSANVSIKRRSTLSTISTMHNAQRTAPFRGTMRKCLRQCAALAALYVCSTSSATAAQHVTPGVIDEQQWLPLVSVPKGAPQWSAAAVQDGVASYAIGDITAPVLRGMHRRTVQLDFHGLPGVAFSPSRSSALLRDGSNGTAAYAAAVLPWNCSEPHRGVHPWAWAARLMQHSAVAGSWTEIDTLGGMGMPISPLSVLRALNAREDLTHPRWEGPLANAACAPDAAALRFGAHPGLSTPAESIFDTYVPTAAAQHTQALAQSAVPSAEQAAAGGPSGSPWVRGCPPGYTSTVRAALEPYAHDHVPAEAPVTVSPHLRPAQFSTPHVHAARHLVPHGGHLALFKTRVCIANSTQAPGGVRVPPAGVGGAAAALQVAPPLPHALTCDWPEVTPAQGEQSAPLPCTSAAAAAAAGGGSEGPLTHPAHSGTVWVVRDTPHYRACLAAVQWGSPQAPCPVSLALEGEEPWNITVLGDKCAGSAAQPGVTLHSAPVAQWSQLHWEAEPLHATFAHTLHERLGVPLHQADPPRAFSVVRAGRVHRVNVHYITLPHSTPTGWPAVQGGALVDSPPHAAQVHVAASVRTAVRSVTTATPLPYNALVVFVHGDGGAAAQGSAAARGMDAQQAWKGDKAAQAQLLQHGHRVVTCHTMQRTGRPWSWRHVHERTGAPLEAHAMLEAMVRDFSSIPAWGDEDFSKTGRFHSGIAIGNVREFVRLFQTLNVTWMQPSALQLVRLHDPWAALPGDPPPSPAALAQCVPGQYLTMPLPELLPAVHIPAQLLDVPEGFPVRDPAGEPDSLRRPFLRAEGAVPRLRTAVVGRVPLEHWDAAVPGTSAAHWNLHMVGPLLLRALERGDGVLHFNGGRFSQDGWKVAALARSAVGARASAGAFAIAAAAALAHTPLHTWTSAVGTAPGVAPLPQHAGYTYGAVPPTAWDSKDALAHLVQGWPLLVPPAWPSALHELAGVVAEDAGTGEEDVGWREDTQRPLRVDTMDDAALDRVLVGTGFLGRPTVLSCPHGGRWHTTHVSVGVGAQWVAACGGSADLVVWQRPARWQAAAVEASLPLMRHAAGGTAAASDRLHPRDALLAASQVRGAAVVAVDATRMTARSLLDGRSAGALRASTAAQWAVAPCHGAAAGDHLHSWPRLLQSLHRTAGRVGVFLSTEQVPGHWPADGTQQQAGAEQVWRPDSFGGGSLWWAVGDVWTTQCPQDTSEALHLQRSVLPGEGVDLNMRHCAAATLGTHGVTARMDPRTMQAQGITSASAVAPAPMQATLDVPAPQDFVHALACTAPGYGAHMPLGVCTSCRTRPLLRHVARGVPAHICDACPLHTYEVPAPSGGGTQCVACPWGTRQLVPSGTLEACIPTAAPACPSGTDRATQPTHIDAPRAPCYAVRCMQGWGAPGNGTACTPCPAGTVGPFPTHVGDNECLVWEDAVRAALHAAAGSGQHGVPGSAQKAATAALSAVASAAQLHTAVPQGTPAALLHAVMRAGPAEALQALPGTLPFIGAPAGALVPQPVVGVMQTAWRVHLHETQVEAPVEDAAEAPAVEPITVGDEGDQGSTLYSDAAEEWQATALLAMCCALGAVPAALCAAAVVARVCPSPHSLQAKLQRKVQKLQGTRGDAVPGSAERSTCTSTCRTKCRRVHRSVVSMDALAVSMPPAPGRAVTWMPTASGCICTAAALLCACLWTLGSVASIVTHGTNVNTALAPPTQAALVATQQVPTAWVVQLPAPLNLPSLCRDAAVWQLPGGSTWRAAQWLPVAVQGGPANGTVAASTWGCLAAVTCLRDYSGTPVLLRRSGDALVRVWAFSGAGGVAAAGGTATWRPLRQHVYAAAAQAALSVTGASHVTAEVSLESVRDTRPVPLWAAAAARMQPSPLWQVGEHAGVQPGGMVLPALDVQQPTESLAAASSAAVLLHASGAPAPWTYSPALHLHTQASRTHIVYTLSMASTPQSALAAFASMASVLLTLLRVVLPQAHAVSSKCRAARAARSRASSAHAAAPSRRNRRGHDSSGPAEVSSRTPAPLDAVPAFPNLRAHDEASHNPLCNAASLAALHLGGTADDARVSWRSVSRRGGR